MKYIHLIYFEVMFVILLTFGALTISLFYKNETISFIKRFFVIRKFLKGEADLYDLMLSMESGTEGVFLQKDGEIVRVK